MEKKSNANITSYEDLEDELNKILILACDLILSTEEEVKIGYDGSIKRFFDTETLLIEYNQDLFGYKDLSRAIKKKLPTVAGKDATIGSYGKMLTVKYEVQVPNNFINDLIHAVLIVNKAKKEEHIDRPRKTEYYLWFAGKCGMHEDMSRISYKTWFAAKMYVYNGGEIWISE